MNQVRANSKKKLSSEQMKIKKELTQKQSAIKIEVFDRVREKLLEYRKTNDYLVYLENQIKNIILYMKFPKPGDKNCSNH